MAVTRAGRTYARRRAAGRLLPPRYPVRRWWRAYAWDLIRHPRAPRCQVNPWFRFAGPERCRVLNAAARPLHHHGTEEQWLRALSQRATYLAHEEAAR